MPPAACPPLSRTARTPILTTSSWLHSRGPAHLPLESTPYQYLVRQWEERRVMEGREEREGGGEWGREDVKVLGRSQVGLPGQTRAHMEGGQAHIRTRLHKNRQIAYGLQQFNIQLGYDSDTLIITYTYVIIWLYIHLKAHGHEALDQYINWLWRISAVSKLILGPLFTWDVTTIQTVYLK